jgi:restriction system protein
MATYKRTYKRRYTPKRYKTSNPFINDGRWFLVLLAVVALPFLPFVAAVVLVIGIPIAIVYWRGQQKRMRRIQSQTIQQIDWMSGREFEERVWVLFKQLGYHSTLTKQSGDYGADVVLVKDGVHTVVQVKRYNKAVDPAAVQQVVASKAMYGCTHAIVVTNHFYTKAARFLAEKNGVELWDRDRLIDELVTLEAAAQVNN